MRLTAFESSQASTGNFCLTKNPILIKQILKAIHCLHYHYSPLCPRTIKYSTTSPTMRTTSMHSLLRNLVIRKRPPAKTPDEAFCALQRFRFRRASFLSPVFNNRLESMVLRHNNLLKEIEESPDNGYLHAKELASLSHAMALHEKKLELEAEEDSIVDLLQELERDGSDDDMAKECKEELENIKSSQKKLERRIRIAILPKDESDYQSDAIIEVRAGTGGDEATLFASELQKAYEKTASFMNWECDIMSKSTTDLGGIKEAVMSISGRGSAGSHFSMIDDEDENALSNLGPYGLFKYERLGLNIVLDLDKEKASTHYLSH